MGSLIFMRSYLVWFVHLHLDFRVPEFESLCATYNIEYELGDMDPLSPFMIVKLPSDEAATLVVKRSILIRGIYEIWGDAKDYVEIEDKLNTFVEENKEMINTKYGTENEWSFKIKVE